MLGCFPFPLTVEFHNACFRIFEAQSHVECSVEDFDRCCFCTEPTGGQPKSSSVSSVSSGMFTEEPKLRSVCGLRGNDGVSSSSSSSYSRIFGQIRESGKIFKHQIEYGSNKGNSKSISVGSCFQYDQLMCYLLRRRLLA